MHGVVQGDTRVPFLDVDAGGVPAGFEEITEPEPLDETGATHRATFHVYSRPSNG